MEDNAYNRELDKFLTITESREAGYRSRTIENASASDITIAFATDFSTAGERLTARAARESARGTYVAIPYSPSPASPVKGLSSDDAVIEVVKTLMANHLYSDLTINIAGNGITTLSRYEGAKQAQEHIDTYVRDVLKGLTDAGVRIKGIRSGGQTGADEAGIKAALSLGIPAHAHYPKGFLRRSISEENTIEDRQYTREEIRALYALSMKEKKIQSIDTRQILPFRLMENYLPGVLKRDVATPFSSISNAMVYLKARFAALTDELLPATDKQENQCRADTACQLTQEALSKDFYDAVAITTKQAMEWSKIEPTVLRSVYMDCFTQNGNALSELLSTGLHPIASDTPEHGNILCAVRDELRECVSRQSTDGWCLVARNTLDSSGRIQEDLNYVNSRGQVFSQEEWFSKAENFSNGLATALTKDGLSIELDATSPENCVSQLTELRQEAVSQTLSESAATVHHSR